MKARSRSAFLLGTALSLACSDSPGARDDASARDAAQAVDDAGPARDAAVDAASARDADAASDHDSGAATPDAGVPDVPPDPSAGCSAEAAAPGTRSASLMVDGVERTYRVHVPPSYDGLQPVALVLMLHGGGGSGRQFEENSARMDPVADAANFVTVYPDGTGLLRTWNGGGCCGSAVTNDVDDVGFVSALLDALEASLCVDRARIFATGMSNGGIMAHRLACELSERIAAIAPVAGTDNTASCTPTRAVPVMQIHGTADGHVPWDGGEGCGPAGVAFTSVPDTIARWAERNGCDPTRTPAFVQGDGTCEQLSGCRGDVVLCSIDGGGHSWPGGEPPAGLVDCPGNGAQSSTFSASEVAYTFFVRHPLR